MERYATIQCRRATRYPDRLRTYRLVVDGSEAARMRAGETVHVRVVPGSRTVTVRLDWMRSNHVNVDCRAGGREVLDCGSRIQGWRHLFILVLAPYYYFVKPHAYLWLRPALHEPLAAEQQAGQGPGLSDRIRNQTAGVPAVG